MSGEGNIGQRAALLKFMGDNAGNMGIVFGEHTTIDEDDTVLVPDLAEVLFVLVSLQSTPLATAAIATGIPGGAGVASLRILTWESDFTVATAFSKLVNFVAIGRAAV